MGRLGYEILVDKAPADPSGCWLSAFAGSRSMDMHVCTVSHEVCEIQKSGECPYFTEFSIK